MTTAARPAALGKRVLRESVWLFHYKVWPKARTHEEPMFLSLPSTAAPRPRQKVVTTAKSGSLRDCDHFVHPACKSALSLRKQVFGAQIDTKSDGDFFLS